MGDFDQGIDGINIMGRTNNPNFQVITDDEVSIKNSKYV